MSQDFTMAGTPFTWLSLAAFALIVCVSVSTGATFPGCVDTWPGVAISDQLSGTIDFPEGDGTTYPHDLFCYWTISAPQGKVIRYSFTLFDIPGKTPDYMGDYLSIGGRGIFINNNYQHYDLATTGMTSVTRSNQLKMAFYGYNDSNDFYQGFVLDWEVADPECGELVTISGSGSGSLDYPLNHDVHANLGRFCSWAITAPAGKIIAWKVNSLNVIYYDWLLGHSSDDNGASQSYMMWNGTSHYASYYYEDTYGTEGVYTADSSFVTLGNTLYLDLYLDTYINAEGFDISWEIYDESCRECLLTKGACEDSDSDGTPDTCTCPEPFSSSALSQGCDQESSTPVGPTWETFTGCVESWPGVVISDQLSGTIDFPEGDGTTYPHDLDCFWTINVPEGKVIRYSFTFFDIAGRTRDYSGDYLRIGSSGIFMNNDYQYYDLATTGMTSVTGSNQLTMALYGDNDSNDFYQGFVLDWEVADPECGERVMISGSGSGSLDYPLNHDVHANLGGVCSWTITAPPGKIIVWKVKSLNVIHYDYLMGISIDDNGAFQSYKMWNGTSDYASYHYEDTHGTEGVHTADGSFVSLSNTLYLNLFLDTYINAEGFDISWEIYDESCRECLLTKGACEDSDSDGTPDTCTCPEPFSSSALSQGCDQESSTPVGPTWETFTGCVESWPGVVISDQLSGTIDFPEGDGTTYPRDLDCYWTINAPEGKVIRYSFTFFDIAGYVYVDYLTFYYGDWLNVYSGIHDVGTYYINNNYQYYDLATTGMTSVTGSNQLAMELYGGNDSDDFYQGFILDWEVVDPECGELMTISGSGSLDYPLNHDVHANLGGYCSWAITAPDGKIIAWKVNSLNVIYFDYLTGDSYDDNGASQSYKMWNGTSDYASYYYEDTYGTEGVYTADGSFVTLSNTLYLDLYLDTYINAEGFDISWEIYDESCRECLLTKGACEDSDSDGTPDTCTCLEPFSSSALSQGCDQESSTPVGPTWETFTGCVESWPGVVISDQLSGTIDFPEGDGTTYPHDLDCYWTINAPEGKVIRYSFTFFDIAGYVYVDYRTFYYGDWLDVYSGIHDVGTYYINNYHQYYDLASTGMTSVTGSNQLAMALYEGNDSDDFYQGFVLDWEVVDPECSDVGELVTISGSGSLDYPLNHDVHANRGGYCTWTIEAPAGKIIAWKVNSLSVVWYDYLRGSSYDDNGDERYYFMWSDAGYHTDYYDYYDTRGGEGAYTADGSFVTLSNTLYLDLFLDTYINAEGFDISWEVYDEICRVCLMTKGTCEDSDSDGTPDTCTCPEPFSSSAFSEGCDQDSSCDPVSPGIVIDDAVSGTLDWPEGINMYRPFAYCFWKIVVAEGKVIRYSFESMSIENYDYFYVRGTDDPDEFTTYNYNLERAVEGRTMVTLHNELSLNFAADRVEYYTTYSLTPDVLHDRPWARYGFVLDWEQADPECSDVGELVTISGSGSLDYPLNHDVHANRGGYCLWTIEAPAGKIIAWKVNSLSVIWYDYLLGSSYDDNGGGRYYFMWSDAGYNTEYYNYLDTRGGEGAYTADGSFVTLSNTLYLDLFLDTYINAEGFDISWEVYDESCRVCLMTKGTCEDSDSDGTPDTCACPEPFSSSAFSEGCDQDSTCDPVSPGIVIDDAVSGTLDWPEGINMYRPFAYCFWKIVVPEGKVIRYSFESLSIENYDYFYVRGTDDPDEYNIYNYNYMQANVMPGETTITLHNELSLNFAADRVEYYTTYSLTPDVLHDRPWARYGFVLDWEQADPECDETFPGIQISSEAGGLDYPLNHQRYSHFMDMCYWTINAPSDKILLFEFDKLDIEYYYDGLLAYDYNGEFSRMFNTGDYSSPVSRITSSGQWVSETNQLVLAMYSDYTYHFSGFTISWTLRDATCFHCLRFMGTCDDSDSDGTVDTCTCPSPYSSSSLENGCDQITGCISTKPGEVIDGNPSGSLEWPPGSNTEYVRSMECYWRINAPDGKVIRYQFSQLSIEAYDYLYVTNGGGKSRTNYWYPAETLDTTTVTLDNFLEIEFQSDGTDYYSRYYDYNYWFYGYYYEVYSYDDAPDLTWTRFGFTVEWEVAEPECSTALPGIEIDGEAVSSLDYPTGHDKHAHFMDNCYWRLVAPEGMVFRFTFTMIDLETGADFLMVFSDDNDFSSSEEDFRFSGNTIPTNSDNGGTYFNSTSNVMNLAMYSDYKGDNTGFVLEWELIPAPTTPPPTPPPSLCPGCENSGGACYDGNMDGDLDACLCPLRRCASTLDAGCDTDCDLVNSVCDPSSPAPCWDYNALCVLRDLSGNYVCACKFGYVPVYEDGEPVRCHRRLSAFHDSSCEPCLQNGGACYDLADARDNNMDGCQCPPTRATDSAPCDTALFTVACTETDMTVCYVPNSLPGHADVAGKLINDEYVLFVTGFYNEFGCHLRRSGDNFCIDLVFESPTTDCGLLMQDSYRSLTYSSGICLQKSPYQRTTEDLRLYAFCTYDKILGIGSGVIDVTGTKRVGSEGEKRVAEIGMLILNDADEDLRTVGLITGDLIKMRLSITDDAEGLFTSLRAEVCVLSDRLSLAHPHAKAVPVVLDGCPEPPLLDASDNFGAINGDLTLQETGLFVSPKFPESSYLFAHCAVRVCMDDTNCQPNTCSSSVPTRRKRDVASRVRQAMEGLMLDPHVQQQVIQIRYISTRDSTLAKQDAAAAAGSVPELLIWIAAAASILILVVTISILLYFHARRARSDSFQL